jgi:hypothetical protein
MFEFVRGPWTPGLTMACWVVFSCLCCLKKAYVFKNCGITRGPIYCR